jgi:DNA-binding transcriptional ArsR family regulator
MAKPTRPFMTAEALQLVAARFKVLADPMRLRLLHALEGGEVSVNELAVAAEASQPNVSKHLKTLQEAGFVTRRQEGNTAYYSIADETVFELCDLVCSGLRQRLAAQASALTEAAPRALRRRR